MVPSTFYPILFYIGYKPYSSWKYLICLFFWIKYKKDFSYLFGGFLRTYEL